MPAPCAGTKKPEPYPGQSSRLRRNRRLSRPGFYFPGDGSRPSLVRSTSLFFLSAGTRETLIGLREAFGRPGLHRGPRVRFWQLLLIGSLMVAGPAPGGQARAGDAGSCRPEVGFFYQRFQAGGLSFSSRESYHALELSQYLTNHGRLEGRLVLVDHRDTWKNRHYLVSLALRDFSLGPGRADLLLGDQPAAISLLPQFFSDLFYPPQYFRGISCQYRWPAGQLTLLGGSVTRSQSFLTESYQSLGERLGGGSLHWQPRDFLWLEGNLYLTRHEVDWQRQLLTHRNLVYRLAALVRLRQELALAGEFLQSFNRPWSRAPVQDLAYRTGAIWERPRWRLEASYRYLGPDFHLINNLFLPQTNTRGYFLAGQAAPWSWLRLAGSYSSSRQNFVPRPDQVVSETDSRSAGVFLAPPGGPAFQLSYSESTIATRQDFPVRFRGRTSGLVAELSWRRWPSLEPYLRGERFAFTAETAGSISYRRTTPALGLRGYQTRFSWYLELQDDHYRPRSAGAGYTGLYFRLGGSCYAGTRLSFTGEISYRPESRRLGGLGSLNWRLPYDCYLRLSGRLERGTLGGGDFLNRFYSSLVMLQFSKDFRWGQRPHGGLRRPGQEWAGSGSIEGYVFEDLNQNGVRDPGEPGFAGVTVRLTDGTAVTTDDQGYYRFPEVVAGTATVILETRRIPARYTFLGEQTQILEVRRRAQQRLDFPFVLGADLEGRVMAARPAGQGVAEALVQLQPGDYNTYTDAEGNFAFYGLPPGTYELSLHPDSLPPYAMLQGDRSKRVTLPPGGRATGLVFTVDLERPVLKLPPAVAR